MAKKQRNQYLNYWKGIACFGVVFVHTRFPLEQLDGILQTMFRFAVPLFFMVSGYFCYGEDRELVEKKLPSKIKRIFWINFGGCFYYFVMQMAIAVFGDSHGNSADVIERFWLLFNRNKMVDWLVFNQDPFVNIMWFTSALLYCYILFWIINHFNLYRVSYGLIPVLIVIHLLMGNVMVMFGMEINKLYYRNFLLFGLPFVLLGNWLHKNQDSIIKKVTIKKCQMIFWIGLILGIAEWFVEGRRELYFGTLLVLISIFLLSIHQPEEKEKSFLTKTGEKYSLFIYVVHYSLIVVMERFSDKLIMSGSMVYYIYGFVRPFLVFGICWAAAYMFYKVLGMLKKWRNK